MTPASEDFGNPQSGQSKCCCGSNAGQKGTFPSLPPYDRRGEIMCRLSDRFRMRYNIAPGLYAIGRPIETSPVLVTANYRLTCGLLRKTMEKSNVWVLVLDTKGINVWCAAGKGTFGTSELVNRITRTNLATVVKHRKLVLPQLGATGVAAHEVQKATGFNISYGPIMAKDIPAFLEAGNKATEAMRTVRFPVWDRFILTPMEFFPALRKFLWVILGIVIIMGIQPKGILYIPALTHSWPIIILGAISVFVGTVLFPVSLPFIPFRSFAAKGALLGLIAVLPSIFLFNDLFLGNIFLATAVVIFFIALVSYLSLNFTGCTPFTNISGVKREMQFAVPVYLSACGIAAVLLVVFKLREWGIV